jgi:tRNA(fMet)-specific endonuclease VapC
MYLLDTNHCSQLIQGQTDVERRLNELGDVQVATCTVVRGELVFWAEKSEQRTENLQRVRAFLEDLEVYPLDDESADIYGRLKSAILNRFGPRERAKRRKAKTERLGFAENDIWIAAIARRHGLIVVSADSDFMRIAEVEDLIVESWVAPVTDQSTPD